MAGLKTTHLLGREDKKLYTGAVLKQARQQSLSLIGVMLCGASAMY